MPANPYRIIIELPKADGVYYVNDHHLTERMTGKVDALLQLQLWPLDGYTVRIEKKDTPS